MVSTGTVPPNPSEQQLPMEADPSGFTERAPALGSLLPDEALARALAGGDALAVHAALVARASRERAGPVKATLKALLAQPELFAVSEAPPRLGVVLGTGISFVGLPSSPQQDEPFVATRALRLLSLPVWPLSQHLVRRGREGGGARRAGGDGGRRDALRHARAVPRQRPVPARAAVRGR